MQTVVQHDIRDIANIRAEDELQHRVQLLALRSGSLLNTTSIANDLKMRRATVDKYIALLEHLFLFYRLPAWHSNSAARLIKAPKIHVVDNGLANVQRQRRMRLKIHIQCRAGIEHQTPAVLQCQRLLLAGSSSDVGNGPAIPVASGWTDTAVITCQPQAHAQASQGRERLQAAAFLSQPAFGGIEALQGFFDAQHTRPRKLGAGPPQAFPRQRMLGGLRPSSE